MANVVLGWILIVLGVIATAAGIGGGVAAMFKEIRRKAEENAAFGPTALPVEFLKALTEFLNALVKAPVWLALVIIGFALIAWGGTNL